MTKIAAVQQSIDTGEIVTVDYDSTLGDMLAAESDDCVVGNKCTEYWGASEGAEWRVHMLHGCPTCGGNCTDHDSDDEA